MPGPRVGRRRELNSVQPRVAACSVRAKLDTGGLQKSLGRVECRDLCRDGSGGIDGTARMWEGRTALLNLVYSRLDM